MPSFILRQLSFLSNLDLFLAGEEREKTAALKTRYRFQLITGAGLSE